MNKKLFILLPVLAMMMTSCGPKNGSEESKEEPVSSESVPEVVAVTGVTLNKTEATLNIGESVTLQATVAPANATNKKITWSVDHEEIATVQKGKVTAVAAGTATVTATTEDGGFVANCVITVNDALFYGTEENPLTPDQAKKLTLENVEKNKFTKEQVWVEGIVFTSSWYAKGSTINGWLWGEEGGDNTLQLYGIGLDQSITDDFSANDALLGYTIKAYGYIQNYNDTTAEFNKASIDGTDFLPLIKSAVAPSAEATGVRVITEGRTIDARQTYKLSARLIPLNAAGSIDWVSSNPDVATVDANGLVTGVSAGTATIRAKVNGTDELYSETGAEMTILEANYVAKCDFTLKAASYSSYSGTWDYDGYAVTNGANNSAGWDYVKLGGKSVTDKESSIVNKTAMPEQIGSVTVSIYSTSSSSTLYKDSEMSCSEWGLVVYSDSTCETQVDKIVSDKAIVKNMNEDVNFVPSTGYGAEKWASGLYFKVYFVLSNSGTTNGIVLIDSIIYNH